MKTDELIKKRLSNGSNLEDGVSALLTDEQFEKISSERRRMGNILDPLYARTYISPSQIIEYFVNNIRYEGSPNQEVYIDFDDKFDISPGNYVFFAEINKERKNILVGEISKNDILEKKIESRYIKRDYSGIIIPITRKVLELELNEKKELVDKGFRENFHTVEKLSEIVGIDFSQELKEARMYDRNQYIKRYSKKEHLNEIFEVLSNIYDLFLNENFTYSDTVYEFLDIAHLIEYPDENYKNKAEEYLNSISKTFLSETKSVKKELDGIVKEKEKRIEKLENIFIKISWIKRKLQGENIKL